MKIVIAPDSFKESLTALEAATAIEKGMREVLHDAEFIKVPMADGGEGTVQSLVDATQGRLIHKMVTGPNGKPVKGFFGLLGDGQTAVIEMAAASGLHLVQGKERNPLNTTTKGTGELISAALDEGVKQIIIGLGGSATNDGGAGMAQALGARLVDANGEEIGFGGGALQTLDRIDIEHLDPRLKVVNFQVACDVDNPLLGERGASAVFGPQKGANEAMIAELDRNLAHYANIIEKNLKLDVREIPGAGAAGGLGAGVLAFLCAEMRRGIDIVMEATGLESVLKDATWVVTGEGRIDSQTIYGKTPNGVAKLAKQFGLPVIGIAGMLSDDASVVHEHGIDAIFSLVPGAVDLETAMAQAESYLTRVSRNIARLIKV